MILKACGLLNISTVIINASIFYSSFNSAIDQALSKIPSCLQCRFKPERNCFSNSIHRMPWNPFFSTQQIIISGSVWSLFERKQKNEFLESWIEFLFPYNCWWDPSWRISSFVFFFFFAVRTPWIGHLHDGLLNYHLISLSLLDAKVNIYVYYPWFIHFIDCAQRSNITPNHVSEVMIPWSSPSLPDWRQRI